MPVSVGNRIAAKAVDFIVMIFFAAVLPTFFGPLLGFLYIICSDGNPLEHWKGQSLGKKLMGLQVRNQVRKAPTNWKDSAIRNSPVGIGAFFLMIPVWGWILAFLVGVPFLVLELYLMVRIDRGHRLGDVMADTEVIMLAAK